MFRKNILIVCLLSCFHAAFADIQPAGIFGDHMVLQQGRPIPVWGWCDANETVTVEFLKQTKTAQADTAGKWTVYLDSTDVGGPFTMAIKGSQTTIAFKDVYVGEVWLCSGQSNMDMTVAKEDRYWCGVQNEVEEVAAAKFPMIRVFDVPFVTADAVQKDVNSKWEMCSPETVGHFSATAYFFARDLHNKLNVPIGLVTTAYGASTAEAWTRRAALEKEPTLQFLLDDDAKKCEDYDSGNALKRYETQLAEWKTASEKAKAEGKKEPRKPGQPRNPHQDQHSPCVLYNGMVAPLVPYAIRGAIWYQGESNGPTADIYDRIMETLIQNWRRDWQQGDFPFYYVQLANYGKPNDPPCRGGSTTKVRDAQLKNLAIPNTGMAVTIDIGDATNIHPKNKQEVGRRLARLARNRVYADTIVDSGPIYDYILINGNSIQIHFKNIRGGLKSQRGTLEGFAIAGKDKKFVWADAKIRNDTVVVSSPLIERPVAVRYAWNDNPTISLINAEGLPASPFRSDDF